MLADDTDRLENEQVIGTWLSPDDSSSEGLFTAPDAVDFERAGLGSVPSLDWLGAETTGLFVGLSTAFSERWAASRPVSGSEPTQFRYGTDLHSDSVRRPDDEGLRRVGRLGSGSSLRFGVNAVRFSPDESTNVKYGSTAAISDDLETLGVNVARQTFDFDLWVAFRDTPIALDEDGALEAQVRSVQADLTTLLATAREHEFQVVLTFLTLGGPNTYAPTGEDDRVVYPLAVSVKEHTALRLLWAEDHLETSDGLDRMYDGHLFKYLVHPLITDSEEDLRGWYLNTLDIDSGYKLAYIELIAGYTVAMLNDIAAAEDLDLADVIAGIEVFNEVDDAFIYTSSKIGIEGIPEYAADYGAEELEYLADPRGVALFVMRAYAWGEAVGRAGEALSALSDVPLWLPGLASYSTDAAAEKTFGHKWLFVKWMLRKLADYDVEWANIDYHWYHREKGQELPAALIPAEVELLRNTLTEAGQTSASVSLLESGVSISDEIWLSDSKTGEAFVPDYADDDEQRRVFQAREVWRRLGAAVAGGSGLVGWHSWMSGSPSNFGLMGLRDDGSLNAEGMTRTSKQAYQRLSWFAYRQLAESLQDVVSAEFLHPEGAVAGEPYSVSRSGADAIGIVAFVLSGTSGSYTRAYLVWVEPMANLEGCSAYIEVTSSSGGEVNVERRPTLPTSIVTGAAPAEDMQLPMLQDDAEWEVSAYYAIGTEPEIFSLAIDSDPILLLATGELVIDPQCASSSGGGGGGGGGGGLDLPPDYRPWDTGDDEERDLVDRGREEFEYEASGG